MEPNLRGIYRTRALVFHHGSPGVTQQDSGPVQSCRRYLITACFKSQKGQVELTFLGLARLRSISLCVRRPAAVGVLHTATSSGVMASAGSLERVRRRTVPEHFTHYRTIELSGFQQYSKSNTAQSIFKALL